MCPQRSILNYSKFVETVQASLDQTLSVVMKAGPGVNLDAGPEELSKYQQSDALQKM